MPLVEQNVSTGVINNVFGTFNLLKLSVLHEVRNFILISTDKAVNPTNVMGATKRVCELILQAAASEDKLSLALGDDAPKNISRKTIFSMVRFGNVLGSSGSVVPKFREQINNGGPITLTHKDITRYFMTIKEAAQLVIQAGAMSVDVGSGAEVYLLDMGRQIKIYDLACRLIELSGLTVKEGASSAGDVEIKITGLRPGEKLYEELLLGNSPVSTKHSRIMKAHESYIPWGELIVQLDVLFSAAENNDIMSIRNVLKSLVNGYTPDRNIADIFHS